MRDGVTWLYQELPELVSSGVLTPEAADALRRHYGPPASRGTRTRWGQILLAAFGALLVGGGLILILAHNWEVLGRPARAAVALSILLCAQALTIFAVGRRRHSMAWIEGTSAFLVTSVGAAIALVGQTYHLGGSFESLLRAWLWLVVLIPYLTGSRLAAIEFWTLIVVRVAALAWHEMPWDPWLLVLAAVPFILLETRRAPDSWGTGLLVLAGCTAVFIVGSLLAAQAGWSRLWAVFQVSLLAAIVAAAWEPSAGRIAGSWRGRLAGPAWVGLVIVGTLLTFDEAWRSGTSIERQLRNPNVIGLVVTALACAMFATVQTVRLAGVGRTAAAVSTAAAPLVVVTHALALVRLDVAGWLAFNLWLLAAGVMTLYEGIRTLQLGAANRGLLALSLLVIVRFFDTELSFLARGLAFVALGIACLGLNFWLMRRTRTEKS